MRRKKAYTGIVVLLGLAAIFYGNVSNLSAIKVISAVVFLSGTSYAILERNLIIGVITFLATLGLPKVGTWFMDYWPWVKVHFFGP